ncbi:MAG: zf-HC2 domain-containing protein [Actinobacteria bacterium]|nr:zf-HC2 domain-containing protein [Actinomycetota bacterium]
MTRRYRFMRDHMWARGRFSAYLDHELDDAESARLERHAHLCPGCHRMLETLIKTLEGLRGLSGASRPPSDLADSVIERIRKEP